MNKQHPAILLRWLTLVIAIINISFDYLLTTFTKLPSVKAVSDQYPSLFTPAPFTFAIWGLIYLGYLVYCIVQLLPSQKKYTIYEKLNPVFIMVNLLGMVWIYVFRLHLLAISEVFIIAMLICGVVLFSISHRAVKFTHYSRWITVPFGLLLGWLSVAVIAGTAAFLVSTGWSGMGISDGVWVMIILGVGLLLSLIIGASSRDIMFPLVIAWGCFGVWINLKDEREIPAQVALIVSVASVLIAVSSAIKQLQPHNSFVEKEDSL